MGRHVHRHAGDIDGKVGAVIQIEAAQKILVGFAVPAVLGNDQARNVLEDFSRTQSRRGFDPPGSDPALARGVRRAHSGIVGADHLDFRGGKFHLCCTERVLTDR